MEENDYSMEENDYKRLLQLLQEAEGITSKYRYANKELVDLWMLVDEALDIHEWYWSEYHEG